MGAARKQVYQVAGRPCPLLADADADDQKI